MHTPSQRGHSPASVDSPIIERPCPSWCTDCTGWEDEGRSRVHRKRFPLPAGAAAEVYSIEMRDASTSEQGTDLMHDESALLGPDELRAYAIALLQASAFMAEHNLNVIRLR